MNSGLRVVVIGTGIVGASVGWHLVRQGADVTFIDSNQPGEGVTNWSFSWVNASNKTVLRSYFDLNVASMTAYRWLATTIDPGSWWHPDGHLRWADSRDAQERLVTTARLLTEWDYRVEVRTGAEVRRLLEPALLVPEETPVVYCPEEAWVHGLRLVERLVGQAVESGAKCRFGTEVCDIGTNADGRVRSLVLHDGTRIDADIVVNAAGPQASRVAGMIGRVLPMRHEPGVVARLTCAQVPVRRAVHAPHIEIRPDGDASAVLHSREVDALINAGAGPADLARRLYESAAQVLPGLRDSHVTAARVVNRPIPDDGFPSVGALAAVPGYYEAVTHSGITLGPIVGRLLATEIVAGYSSDLLSDFRPDRYT